MHGGSDVLQFTVGHPQRSEAVGEGSVQAEVVLQVGTLQEGEGGGGRGEEGEGRERGSVVVNGF